MKKLTLTLTWLTFLGLRTVNGGTLTYQVTEIGPVLSAWTGDNDPVNLAINNAGQVAGTSAFGSATPHAFLYTPGSGMQDLGTIGPYGISVGKGLDDSGRVTGWFYGNDPASGPHAFVYTPGGGIQDLGTALSPAQGNSLGLGINDSGKVTGATVLADGQTRAYVDSGSNIQYLGPKSSYGLAINAGGQVTGFFDDGDANQAFLYTPGAGIREIDTLDGDSSVGTAVNANGWVTGWVVVEDQTRAFLYKAATGMSDLGTLPRGYASYGLGINSSGWVVGEFGPQGAAYSAFLYRDGTGLVDLNSLIDPSLGIHLTAAYGINDEEQIVATDGTNAFVLTPALSATASVATAEPASTLLVIGGLAILIGRTRITGKAS
jgi:probable HAF family extracellular repeat protein